MSPNAKPAGDWRTKPGILILKNSSAQPWESLKAKECYTQIAVGQGALIFINVAKGDATTWCPIISLSGTQYLNEPSGQP